MSLGHTILLTTFYVLRVTANTIDNGVLSEPSVECLKDSLRVDFNTEKEFEGHVYVKGHYNDKQCRTDATLVQHVNLSIPFTSCDVRRERSNDPRGLFISITMIITFHPMFITKIDRSYNVKCFYREADRTVSTQMDVRLGKEQQKKILVLIGGDEQHFQSLSQQNASYDDTGAAIPAEFITQQLPLPPCKYEVLDGGPHGEPVKFATVGQQVYHKWSCEPTDDKLLQTNVYCATVHSCTVKEEGGKEVQLLDENGCAVDKYLLNNLVYTSDLTGGQISQVFKFADQPSLFFHCQIKLSYKENGCKRPSDTCSDAIRGKRDLPLIATTTTTTTTTTHSVVHDADVFSQRMIVFEIDEPIDSKTIQMFDERMPLFSRHTVCVSSITFTAMCTLLAIVTLVSFVVVVLLLCLRSRSVKLNLLG